MYELYLDGMRFPVAPGKLEVKIKNKNSTVTLIDSGEINLLKHPGLTDIEFEVLLPNQAYPFAVYPNGYKPASYYIEQLVNIKNKLTAVSFVVSRFDVSGIFLFGTSLNVSLEDCSMIDDASQGTDILVKIKLKQYRDYRTKVYNLTPSEPTTENGSTSSPVASSASALKVGSRVKIKEGAKWYNGAIIPDWVYLNTYTVSAVGVGGKVDCVLLDRTGINSLIAATHLTVLNGATVTTP